MGLSFWHLLVVLAVVLVVFGAGRLPQVMGDLGKGVRNFKAGLDGKDGKDDNAAAKTIAKPDSDKNA